MEKLRDWTETHIQEEVSLAGADKNDALYYECTISSIKGATLKNCVFANSKLKTQSPADVAGATVTLNCHTFGSLELDEDTFDLFLLLLCKTKGNREKRQKIIDDVIGREKVRKLLAVMRTEF